MTTPEFDPTGYFVAKVIDGYRITIPEGVRLANKIEEGDRVTMRFVRIAVKRPPPKQEDDQHE